MKAQCGNFRIIMSFSFYVKSSSKNAILLFLGLGIWLIFKIQQVKKIIKIKIKILCILYQNDTFCTSRIPKIDVTQNLRDRKIMKFLHCGKCIIFLSLKFYVKSIFWMVKVQNLPFYLPHSVVLNFDFYAILNFLNIEIQSP